MARSENPLSIVLLICAKMEIEAKIETYKKLNDDNAVRFHQRDLDEINAGIQYIREGEANEAMRREADCWECEES